MRLNGANEVAVDLVLRGELPFFRIADLLAETLSREGARPVREVADVLDADRRAREAAVPWPGGGPSDFFLAKR